MSLRAVESTQNFQALQIHGAFCPYYLQYPLNLLKKTPFEISYLIFQPEQEPQLRPLWPCLLIEQRYKLGRYDRQQKNALHRLDRGGANMMFCMLFHLQVHDTSYRTAMSYCLPSLLSDYIPIRGEVVSSLTEGTLLNGQTETIKLFWSDEIEWHDKTKNMLTEVFSFLSCHCFHVFFISASRTEVKKFMRIRPNIITLKTYE